MIVIPKTVNVSNLLSLLINSKMITRSPNAVDIVWRWAVIKNMNVVIEFNTILRGPK